MVLNNPEIFSSKDDLERCMEAESKYERDIDKVFFNEASSTYIESCATSTTTGIILFRTEGGVSSGCVAVRPRNISVAYLRKLVPTEAIVS